MWNLFFIAQMVDIGEGEMGFVLGTHNIPKSAVVIVETVGANSMFIYVTNNNAMALKAYVMPEFRGFGYTDMIWRIACGLSNAGSQTEMKYVTGAHWRSDNEWHFGNIHDWEAAGKPEPMWFGRYRGIMGVDIQ